MLRLRGNASGQDERLETFWVVIMSEVFYGIESAYDLVDRVDVLRNQWLLGKMMSWMNWIRASQRFCLDLWNDLSRLECYSKVHFQIPSFSFSLL